MRALMLAVAGMLIPTLAHGLSCPRTACYSVEFVVESCQHTSNLKPPSLTKNYPGIILQAAEVNARPVPCAAGEIELKGGSDTLTEPNPLRENIANKHRFFYKADNPSACSGLIGRKVVLFAPEIFCVDDRGLGLNEGSERLLEPLPIHAE